MIEWLVAGHPMQEYNSHEKERAGIPHWRKYSGFFFIYSLEIGRFIPIFD